MNTHALVTPTPIDLGFARRPRRGYLVPRPGAGGPSTLFGRSLQTVQRLLLGSPIPTAGEAAERLSKITALAVFSSDALSSVAYATEEIMKVLLLVGIGALTLTVPVSLVIVALMAIVVVSYRQTIKAYPKGGGSYIVASDNLGTLPGLTAAASLLLDYVLTVAVSVAAGVAAITSLLPDLLPYTVPIAVGAVVLISVANLRGLRESGAVFAVPAYLFVGLVIALIAIGLFRFATGGLTYTPPESALAPGSQSLGVFLLLSCLGPGNFFPTTDQLYAQQHQWVGKIQDVSEAEQQRIQGLPMKEQAAALVRAAGVDKILIERGVPAARIDTCLADEPRLLRLVEDTRAASTLGVTGTPTFMLNGKILKGVYSWEALEPRLRQGG